MNSTTFDVFICIHRRDVDYLLETVLQSYRANFIAKGALFLITNDLPYLQDFIARRAPDIHPTLFSDNQWLSQREQALPGWFRQQIIKLRAYEFCSTSNFCNLGADTILLQPITAEDLMDNGFPILYYTPHWLPDPHARYEQERVRNVAALLKVDPVNARKYGDFINDLFCFNREALIGLNRTLDAAYGADYYYTLLNGLKTVTTDQNKFGEWTLYSVYLLDYLKRAITVRSTRPDFLYQVHSPRWLAFYRFNTKVAHFVGKNFDIDYIKRRLCERGLKV